LNFNINSMRIVKLGDDPRSSSSGLAASPGKFQDGIGVVQFHREHSRRLARDTRTMTIRRHARQAAAWIIACWAMAAVVVIALGQPGYSKTPEAVPVEGIVTYSGPLPKPIPIAEAGTVRQLIEIEPKTKGLKDAAVWLVGTPPAVKSAAGSKAWSVQMDQRDYRFVPHVLTVDAGQQVEFVNSDVSNHGVTAASLEVENRFNMTTPQGGAYKHRFVASRRPVAIGCPIHQAMSAWIYVFNHPYHAVTDERGSFRLPPVQPGSYTLRAHHPDGGMANRRELIVRPGPSVRVRIEFGEKDLKAGAGEKASQ
jgi:plastocyanin